MDKKTYLFTMGSLVEVTELRFCHLLLAVSQGHLTARGEHWRAENFPFSNFYFHASVIPCYSVVKNSLPLG